MNGWSDEKSLWSGLLCRWSYGMKFRTISVGKVFGMNFRRIFIGKIYFWLHLLLFLVSVFYCWFCSDLVSGSGLAQGFWGFHPFSRFSNDSKEIQSLEKITWLQWAPYASVKPQSLPQTQRRYKGTGNFECGETRLRLGNKTVQFIFF